MSQAGIISIAGGGGPGSPIETVTGNTGGTVSPQGNNINLVGGSSPINNTNGITVVGNNATATETITLTNRFQSSASFSDAIQHNLYTQSLGAVPATYLFDIRLVAINLTSSLGAAYSVLIPLRTTGVGAFAIATQEFYEAEEGAMIGVTVSAGRSGNSFVVNVQGYNTDTIDWNLTGTYTVVT